MDEFLEKIMDSDKWPTIDTPDNLELLNELADECFAKGDFVSLLSATLMYHQIVEAMCIHLIEDCHYYVQLAVYPCTISFSMKKDAMLGTYISSLEHTIDFPDKELFLERVKCFNSYRTKAVHEMRRTNLKEIEKLLRNVKSCFDEIYTLYDQIQDNFRVDFHGFQKDVFIDYIDEESDEE